MRRVAIALIAGAALVGCNAHSAKPVSLPDPVASPTSTATPPSPSVSPSASAAATGAAKNLVVTDDLRTQLVAAGAKSHGLTSADYTGLTKGETYYARDGDTEWAGAQLVPSDSSEQAQVSSQDDGSYLLFRRTTGGSWTVWDVGVAGGPEGSGCPVAVPVGVLAVWHWHANSCAPPTF